MPAVTVVEVTHHVMAFKGGIVGCQCWLQVSSGTTTAAIMDVAYPLHAAVVHAVGPWGLRLPSPHAVSCIRICCICACNRAQI